MFTTTGGDRGAECGASAEGWRERPALALFDFQFAFDVSADFHVGVPSKWVGIGLHTYTHVQWNTTTLGRTFAPLGEPDGPHPPTPLPFGLC